MASPSVKIRSGVTTPIPRFLVEFDEVEMKPNNHLPLLGIPKGKEYFMEARNLLFSGPAKTAAKGCSTSEWSYIPAVKELLFNLWVTALVVT